LHESFHWPAVEDNTVPTTPEPDGDITGSTVFVTVGRHAGGGGPPDATMAEAVAANTTNTAKLRADADDQRTRPFFQML
jgi:hypothetical protein